MVDMETFAVLRACQFFGVPLIGLRGISDGAAELSHDAVDDRKSKTRPGPAARSEERLEQAFHDVGRDAGSLIGHGQPMRVKRCG